MAETTRSASARWQGPVDTGGGSVSGASGAFTALPISLPTRIGDWGGQSSPEELLAAAFAASFVMAVAAELLAMGCHPTELDVLADCNSSSVTNQVTLTSIDANVIVVTDGLPPEGIEEAVRRALGRCTIGQLLQAMVPIQLSVTRPQPNG